MASDSGPGLDVSTDPGANDNYNENPVAAEEVQPFDYSMVGNSAMAASIFS